MSQPLTRDGSGVCVPVLWISLHRDEAALMVEITRTTDQWRVTACRLDQRHPGYPEAAQRIRAMIVVNRCAPPGTPLSLSFTAEEAAVVLARAPLSAWWMPASSVSLLTQLEAAFAEAEEIIRAIVRARQPSCLPREEWGRPKTEWG